MKKSAPIFTLIPDRMLAYCPCCIGKGHDDPVVTLYPTLDLSRGTGDRWTGDCPSCRTRFTVTLPPVRTIAEWDDAITAAAVPA